MKVEYPTAEGFPSEKILPLIPALFQRIVPEKQALIQQALENVTLAITDNSEWDCKASKGWNLIIISRKTVEVVWAFSYAYWFFYQEFTKVGSPDGQTMNLGANSSLKAPRQLLVWAIDNLTRREVSELPTGLPSIQDAIVEGSDLHAVLEIALTTIAFFLHHELAHLKFASRGITQAILDEERACDKEAASIMLEVEDKALQNQDAIGTANGLLLINAIGFSSGFFDGIEHPFAYDRLISLEEWIDPENDLVWGWVVSMLALHMTNAGLAQPTQVFETFHDCAKAYVKIIAEHPFKK